MHERARGRKAARQPALPQPSHTLTHTHSVNMEEEWRECSQWLVRIGLISEDHLLATQNAKLTDFYRFLRDGVMLCKLLHIIDSDSIDLRSINQRPQSAQVKERDRINNNRADFSKKNFAGALMSRISTTKSLYTHSLLIYLS